MAKAAKSQAFDTDRQYLGSVYAKALLGATNQARNTESVLAEFETFVAEVLDRVPKLATLLASPRVPHAAKEQVLDRVLGGKSSQQLLCFLKVVSKHGRMDCLRQASLAARQLFSEQQGRLEVIVKTAEPLDDAQRRAVVERLRATLGKEIDLKAEVDQALISGVVVRVGDTVYDGSVANRLQRLQADVVGRTAERIRASIDRFSSAS